MSWWAGRSLTWLQDFAANVVKCGHVPEHVAFIMDGNRRYARKKNMEVEYWHTEGFEKMKELTYWCKEIGIREATVYGFSIENFKRTAREVDALMDLTRTQFTYILEGLVEFMKDDICIRVLGNLDLLPSDIRRLAAQIQCWTKNNKTFILNLAFAYTARDEITNAIKIIAEGVREGSLDPADIDEELLSNCMFTNRSKDPEVLVRTAGETRLSDFLLWQTRNTNVYVEDFMWPELGFWNLLKIVVQYQIHYNDFQKKFLKIETRKPSAKKERFLKKLDYSRMRLLERHMNTN